MSPVKPDDLEPLIINDDDDWCVAFRKLTHSFYLFWKLVRYLVDSTGAITKTSATAQFGTDLCSQIDCTEE